MPLQRGRGIEQRGDRPLGEGEQGIGGRGRHVAHRIGASRGGHEVSAPGHRGRTGSNEGGRATKIAWCSNGGRRRAARRCAGAGRIALVIPTEVGDHRDEDAQGQGRTGAGEGQHLQRRIGEPLSNRPEHVLLGAGDHLQAHAVFGQQPRPNVLLQAQAEGIRAIGVHLGGAHAHRNPYRQAQRTDAPGGGCITLFCPWLSIAGVIDV